mgnify:CR=1 FL=1
MVSSTSMNVADITAIVRGLGDGDYHLERMAKGFEVDINGASMMVYFDGAAGTPRFDTMQWEGNDSNLSFANI